MHFGMTGWFKIRNLETFYYKPSKTTSDDPWPPKYSKFSLSTASTPPVEAAFIDSRRFARIRLLDCPAASIRSLPPLSDNGPDPVQDKELVTEEWLAELLGRKHVPIKALLLDQSNISGIGNWVGDELLYHAKIHPEQYSNTLSPRQISQLHKSVHHICGLAVELLADSEKFPEDWLFKHRWGKGKKDAPKSLPNGKRITFVTVGGRTSAVIASVQKKTGPVAGDVAGEEAESGDEGSTSARNGKKVASKKRKAGGGDEPDDHDDADEEAEEVVKQEETSPPKRRKTPKKDVKDEASSEQAEGIASVQRKATPKSRAAKSTKKGANPVPVPETQQKGRRRSARGRGQGP